MKITLAETYEFDMDAEMTRIAECFGDGPYFDTLMKLVDLFEHEKWNEFADLYNSMPYCDESECPSQEYVHFFLVEIVSKILNGQRVVYFDKP